MPACKATEAAKANKAAGRMIASLRRELYGIKKDLARSLRHFIGFPPASWHARCPGSGVAGSPRQGSALPVHRLDAMSVRKERPSPMKAMAFAIQLADAIRGPKRPRTTAPPVRAPAARRSVPAQNGSKAAGSLPVLASCRPPDRRRCDSRTLRPPR